ncbi:MAG: stage II sporulation protein P [Clostridia bacterium]|nr:stage II sporulation protein P [Clostridia bacterium]
MKKALICALLLCLMAIPALAEEGDEQTIYRIVDEQGETVTWYCGQPEVGDEYIAGDNRHFRITGVDNTRRTAQADTLGVYEMPDVSWLYQDALPVASRQKAVAIYCTHSDESYEPTDGKSSDEERGGIYDVAEEFKAALEEEGITVYYSDETHHPHDAGAYRRSRATAVNLVEKGVDAVMDIHRDGIEDPDSYESTVEGEEMTKVRLLVGRSNQNAGANKAFATQIKAVGDEMYPGLIKDIYIGKGTYNQDLMPQAVLLEFGTYTNNKEDVLASTGHMAQVMNKTLYGSVSGTQAAEKQESKGAFGGIIWLVVLAVVEAPPGQYRHRKARGHLHSSPDHRSFLH